MLDQASLVENVVLNGIDVTEYEEIVKAVEEQPDLGRFEFRARNIWDDGGYSRTQIKGFYGAGEEQGAQTRSFEVGVDEPPVLLGEDRAPNPMEYLLHALAGCLTSSIVYKAASRGIRIESVAATLEGDLDARRFLELSNQVRLGYQNIRATFKVRSEASSEEIKQLAEFSPVLDVVKHGTSVSIEIEKV